MNISHISHVSLVCIIFHFTLSTHRHILEHIEPYTLHTSSSIRLLFVIINRKGEKDIPFHRTYILKPSKRIFILNPSEKMFPFPWKMIPLRWRRISKKWRWRWMDIKEDTFWKWMKINGIYIPSSIPFHSLFLSILFIDTRKHMHICNCTCIRQKIASLWTIWRLIFEQLFLSNCSHNFVLSPSN